VRGNTAERVAVFIEDVVGETEEEEVDGTEEEEEGEAEGPATGGTAGEMTLDAEEERVPEVVLKLFDEAFIMPTPLPKILSLIFSSDFLRCDRAACTL
jgi:hypothetical protein